MQQSMLATAMGEGGPSERARVHDHLKRCPSCRIEFEQYRAANGLVLSARRDTFRHPRIATARKALEGRLADLRQRLVAYGIFPSPIGPILIARSEKGISFVEYLQRRNINGSRLSRTPDIEAVERRQELEPFHQDLLDYLARRRAHLDWPLDLRLVRSDFQRKILQTTAGVPYGAVTSYTAIARNIGKPRGVRAVAQALRWNPLPIVIPCHRVIGTSGFLTGYAGGKVRLKRLLLAAEGIQLFQSYRDFKINPEIMYACAPGDHSYCLPTCRSLRRVKPGRATLFASRASAEAAGLSPCTTCRPDLHSISA
jgi:methylated-DNA-[protein]-cysteine S-methyltransferase